MAFPLSTGIQLHKLTRSSVMMIIGLRLKNKWPQVSGKPLIYKGLNPLCKFFCWPKVSTSFETLGLAGESRIQSLVRRQSLVQKDTRCSLPEAHLGWDCSAGSWVFIPWWPNGIRYWAEMGCQVHGIVYHQITSGKSQKRCHISRNCWKHYAKNCGKTIRVKWLHFHIFLPPHNANAGRRSPTIVGGLTMLNRKQISNHIKEICCI